MIYVGLILFAFGFGTSLWGSFEFAYTLYENGFIDSPIWSGTFGGYIPHHYLVGFIITAIGFILIEVRRWYGNHGRKTEFIG